MVWMILADICSLILTVEMHNYSIKLVNKSYTITMTMGTSGKNQVVMVLLHHNHLCYLCLNLEWLCTGTMELLCTGMNDGLQTASYHDDISTSIVPVKQSIKFGTIWQIFLFSAAPKNVGKGKECLD